MADPDRQLQILLIQYWIHDVRPIRTALEVAGITAAITRVDIEPALHAALTIGRYDAVIYDPATTSLSRTAAEECLRSVRKDLALIVADDLDGLGARLLAALQARSS